MKRLVSLGCVVCAGIVLAMPTRKDLAKALEMVNDVTASDVKALKVGTKKPAEVAATHMDLAAKANSEAEKYLLLQGAFNISAKAGDFDAAADALETMVKDIPDMRPDVIVEIYNKAIFRSMKDKAPRLYAIKEAARKAAANRKRLPELEKAARVKPQDAKAQKALGECHAELGNWDKALAAFAKSDGDLAKKAKAELDGTLKPQELADFWWDYNEGSNAYRLHAVSFYRDALVDNGFQGLTRERAERRIKEMEADRGANIESLAQLTKTQDASASSAVEVKGGEMVKLTLDAKAKTVIEFATCPAGKFMMGKAEEHCPKQHVVEFTYPFLIMAGHLTYDHLEKIDAGLEKKCRKAQPLEVSQVIKGDMAASRLTLADLESVKKALALKARRLASFLRFPGYEFRLPTEAEWMYALWANDGGYAMGVLSKKEKEDAYQLLGCPKMERYPPVPESYVTEVLRKPRSPWGLYEMRDVWESVVDTIQRPLLKQGGELRFVGLNHAANYDSVFGYADRETNPLRAYRGKDARGMSIAMGWMKFPIQINNREYGNIRLVYAPKLSALNVYPRTAKDGSVKAHNGAVIAPAKTDATITQKEPIRLALDSNAKNTMTFNFCPSGSATVGKIACSVTKNFYMETVPVTRRQWFAIQRKPVLAWQGGEDAPMTYVSRKEVVEVCQNLTKRFSGKLPQGYVVRLPTVAEWYRAYEKGETMPQGSKKDRKACDELGWFGQGVDGNSGSAGMRRYYLDANMPIPLVADVWTEFPPKKIEVKKGWVEHSSQFAPVPVGLKKANKLGLHDMLGNCFEMTYDGAAESNTSEGTYGVFGYSYGKEIYRGIGTDLVDPVHLAGDGILSVGNPLAPDGGVYIWAATFERSPNIGLRLCLAPPVKTAMP